MSRAPPAFQVFDHAGVELVGARTRQVCRDLAILGRERRDLPRRQRTDTRALHAHGDVAERLPRLPFFREKTLRGDRCPTDPRLLRPGRESATALALLLGEDRDEIALRIPAAARES